MDNPRPEKVAVVDEVRERLDDAEAAAAHRVPRAQRGAPWPSSAARCATPAASTRSTRTPWCASPPATSASRSTTCSPARPPSPSSTGRRRVARGQGAARLRQDQPGAGRQGRRARRQARSTADDVKALADLRAPRGAARPSSPARSRPRCSSSPACSRPCPATSPTACRPSSTQGGAPGARRAAAAAEARGRAADRGRRRAAADAEADAPAEPGRRADDAAAEPPTTPTPTRPSRPTTPQES